MLLLAIFEVIINIRIPCVSLPPPAVGRLRRTGLPQPSGWQSKQGGYGDILPNQGTLLCDGYSGYKALFDPAGDFEMTAAHCWAHARRKFVEAAVGNPQLSQEALDLIGKLYKFEAEVKRQWPARAAPDTSEPIQGGDA